MHLRTPAVLVALAVAGPAAAGAVPVADHHQHLFSPALAELLGTPERTFAPITARDLIGHLDAAGIRRAVVLSAAYMYGRPSRKVDDEYAKVRAENDWVGAQAALYPDRLRAFCSVNPLKDYALEEIARCANQPSLRHGLKLHLGNSDVQVDDPAHLAQLRRVFVAANGHGMAVVVHMRASISLKRPYGADQARVFLDKILPLADRIHVQVAHLAGTGPGFEDPPALAAMAVLADAVAKDDRRTRKLWFDVTTVAGGANSPATTARLVELIRLVGVKRVLYGSDAAIAPNSPAAAWADFRRLPLTAEEFATIAANVAPYLQKY
jgi:predicted TIM-barrel fold metal-dependent hydrolase